ncbi:MAG TPA: preprotein translocase subunit SecA [Candidatus Thiothrix moscowensis]|uniref:preprotein translocase subunit SecA n=1 Tax=unclassified Thiothrix TaxID=2636184 RepID=UPI002600E24B|nr:MULTISPECIES: preprotein translocase subunit SecA [unclassified Thiothrix]HRJ51676.1 preprotein translocase subunit SecA [Candidatus Thiothrix moscowensis]HRJ91991.1 preprotein translocase subunit SecA [Candidatus Thiothrix moscowensis]
MLGSVARKIFGSRNDRLVKSYSKVVKKINTFEAQFKALSDAQLNAKTDEFRARLQQGEALESLLPEAFAVVREAGQRTLGLRHYDVQMIGGMVLNDGKISEMKTGEGKTLVATLAAYLNALPGNGMHVITVNDYLAQRDAAQMSKLYGFLGMTTGVIINGLTSEQRREAYAADITYGTNNEFGFDYLRDNMAFRKEERVQRPLYYAIVDEVDSILIDEARTPLIISGPSHDASQLYMAIDKLIPSLVKQQEEEGAGDFSVDEKARQVYLTEAGQERVEQLLWQAGVLPEGQGLYDTVSISVLHHLNAALRAHALFHRNVDYIVRDGKIVIVDEFTGRTMPGRRWSEGLHQAIEAKENVEIQAENQTLASITFQNYFRLYEKLSGMTGTADTEAFELQQIYGLEVVVIPTHRPMVRIDSNDLVYLTAEEKYEAIIKEIQDQVAKGRPVLVGTASIDTSELVSEKLKTLRIPHEVLNAKQHEREAHIVANAGRPGAVTIATNMAGRGTDIVLGGSVDEEIRQLGDNPDPDAVAKIRALWQKRHDAVVASGGLHILGTERHESRRIDNQLRGRAGRQGDPGSSRFFLSLEDSLMRIFASDRVKGMMQRLGMERGQAIEAGLVSKSIENAQRKVEAHNYDIRKHLLEYDDVANDQRKVVYSQRNDLLEAEDIGETIVAIREDVVDAMFAAHIPPGSVDEQWDVEGLHKQLYTDFGIDLPIKQWLATEKNLHEESLRDRIQEQVAAVLQNKEDMIGAPNMRRLERDIMLHVLDGEWKEHLAAMDYLRQSVGLRGYAQKNPKQEYKREAFEMFEQLLDRVKHDVIAFIMRIQLQEPQKAMAELEEHPQQQMEFSHPQAGSVLAEDEEVVDAVVGNDTYQRDSAKVGRNDPCPCGSGKKYKNCHGKLA